MPRVKCQKCGKGDLREIGDQVCIETKVGRGTDRTDYIFYQCSKCKSIWTQYEDSGAGGHGRFWKCLTEGLF